MLLAGQLVRDYGDPWQEARNCRADCALFDFSFVQRARISGANVVCRLETYQPRAVRDMPVGRIRYSVKLDAQGRVRSDLTLWRLAANEFEVMSGCRDDILELLALAQAGFEVTDLGADTAILAIQGPGTLACLDGLTDTARLRRLPYFGFIESRIDGLPCVIGRLGYSGEQGFEILLQRPARARLWDRLAQRAPPAGFAAIDILRIEAGLFLFTNECRIGPTLSELGLSALLGQGAAQPGLRFTGFRAESDSRPVLWQPDGRRVSRPPDGAIAVTSACYSPHIDGTIGLGFVTAAGSREAVTDPGGQFRAIELVSPPLYDHDKIIPRQEWAANPR